MATQESVEALQLLIADKDFTIAGLKARTKVYIAEMNANHAQALEQETLLKQRAQDKLELVKPMFMKFSEEKKVLTEELNTRNIELKTLKEAKEETTNSLQSLQKEMSALKEEKVNIMKSENILKLQLLESKKESFHTPCRDIVPVNSRPAFNDNWH